MKWMSESLATAARRRTLLANLNGHRIGLLGLGISGRAMATLLDERGAWVLAVDSSPDAQPPQGFGGELRLGHYDADVFAECEALVISPGADPAQPAAQAVWASGRPVFGELALVGTAPAPVIGVTGTNGKSTTSALITALLGEGAFLCGNFGEPLCLLRKQPDLRWVVAELSSYQLETAFDFRVNIGVLLNVTPDHLERYPNFEGYLAAKSQLFAHQQAGDRALVSIDHEANLRVLEELSGRAITFSTRSTQADLWVESGCLRSTKLPALDGFALEHPRLLGEHNRENAVAAVLAAHLAMPDLAAEKLQQRYLAFEGLPHRLEWVCERQGVRFVNDSKATNPTSTAKAVAAMPDPLWLLLGGRSKGTGYAEVQAAISGRDIAVLAFGEAADEVARSFSSALLDRFDSVDEALARAFSDAPSQTTVLFSPACSSFDAFANYAERGDYFRDQARAFCEGSR